MTQEFQIVEEENINPQGVVINKECFISTPTKEESDFSDEESRASNEETRASRAFNMRKEEKSIDTYVDNFLPSEMKINDQVINENNKNHISLKKIALLAENIKMDLNKNQSTCKPCSEKSKTILSGYSIRN